MDAADPQHPDKQTLTDYGLGKLDDQRASRVDAHLQSCLECQRRVGGVTSDSFLNRVRGTQKSPARSVTGDSPADGSLSYFQPKVTAPPPPADTLPPGLADHPDYQVKRELGRGGMGVVYLAHNSMMGRDEVLKVIGRHVIERPGVLDRFQREIRAVARLRHPNIVAAYTAFRLDGGLVFAMEYVEGLDLSKLVKAKGPLAVAHAAYFVHQAALGLQHAHDREMVHRDIKPHNLMLTHDGKARVIKVLDFGLAKATREQTIDGALTSQGQALGTPDYIAPEQILDAAAADIRADLYSLGGTLFYLLTGRPPFQAASLYDMYQAHISRDADPLNLIRPEVPAELAALVAKMMAKDPKRRFQTPKEVAEALTPFFKGKATPPAARPPLASPISPPPTGTRVDRSTSTPGTPRTAEPAADDRPWEAMIDLGDAEPSILPTRSAKSGPSRAAWVKPALIAAGVLASLIACWAFLSFSARTPNGAILVDDVPADARVEVENGTMTITRAGDTATVTEVPLGREYRIKVVQGETTLWAEDVTVRVGGMPVRMKYKPNPDLAASETKTPDLEPSMNNRLDLAPSVNKKREPLARFPVSRGGGDWTIDGDELVQSQLEPEPGRPPTYSIEFGDRSWTDYDISVEACKTAGSDGFGVGFRCQASRDFHVIDFGTNGNRACDLVHVLNGQWGRNQANYREKAISFGEWHPIKIEVRGSRARCYFDGDLLFDEPNLLFPRGKIRLGTWKTAVRFRNIKVTSPTGETLIEGLPDLPRSKAQEVLEPKRGLADRPVETPGPVLSSNSPVPLFNVKDINDWSAWGTDRPLSGPGKEAVWTVRDGILHGEGAQSHLFSPRGDYQNFRVRAEVKINDGGNSGLFFRARKMAGFPDGYEAQINATAADPNKTGSLYRNPQPPYRISPSPVSADTWFVLEAEAVDDHIRVRVDGKPQVEWTDPARTYTRGHFAIQAHNPRTHIQVRKLEITELEPAEPGRPNKVPPTSPAAAKPGKKPSPQDAQAARIKALADALEKRVPMHHRNTPLVDFVNNIKEATRGADGSVIPIYIDPVGVEDADKEMDSPVRFDLEGVPLKDTLRLALKTLALDYCVKDGLVFISGPEFIEKESSRGPRVLNDGTPASKAVLAALEQPIPMNFPRATSIGDLTNYLTRTLKHANGTGVPIYVDPLGLEDADRTMNSPVRIDLEGIPLRITLRMALQQLWMDYYIKDGILIISNYEFFPKNWR